MGKAPAFQFYAGDFYLGTSHFSCAAVGLYARALAWSWDHGALPLDEKIRAQVLLVTMAEFRKLWPTVGAKWIQGEHGYTNRRLEEERTKQAEYRAKQSRKGQASAAARVSLESNHGSTAVQPRYQPEGQPGAQPQPNSSSSSSSSPSKITGAEQWGAPSGTNTQARQKYGAPLMASPLAHRSHGWCNDRGLCVPMDFYNELVGRMGGPHREPELKAWMGTVIDNLGPQVPGESVWKFWGSRFEQWQGSTAPISQPRGKETLGAKAIRAHNEFVSDLHARTPAPVRPTLGPQRPQRQIAAGE